MKEREPMNQDHLKRIDSLLSINNDHSVMSEWEIDYLSSIKEQINKGRTLSPRQNDILQKLEVKLSPENLKSLADWNSNWDDEKKQIALICAKYYDEQGMYFLSTAKKMVTNPDWIMPEKLYNKMCCNKFAKKVLNTINSEQKYPNGSVVMLRKTSFGSHGISHNEFNNWYGDKLLFVLGTLNEVRSAAKGAKIYTLLPAGGATTFNLEERFIKKAKLITKKAKESK